MTCNRRGSSSRWTRRPPPSWGVALHPEKIVRLHQHIILNLLLLGRVALVRGRAGYSHQTFRWTICWSFCLPVCLSVCLSVRPVHCGITADRIQMPFGIMGRTGPGMRQVVGFGDRCMIRGTFGGEFGAHLGPQGPSGRTALQHCDAALLPNYFGQTCYS